MNENYYYHLAASSLGLLITGAVYLSFMNRNDSSKDLSELLNTHKKMCFVAGAIMVVIGSITLAGLYYETPVQRMSLRG